MWFGQPSISPLSTVNVALFAGTFEPVALQAIFRKLPAGNPSVPPDVVGLIAEALVKMSGSGLPLASVSKGVFGGMLLPRRRMYCDAWTFEILNVITLNSRSWRSVDQL